MSADVMGMSLPCLSVVLEMRELQDAHSSDTHAHFVTTAWYALQLTCQRFLACARCKLWWMTPEWGSRALHIPPETQFMLFQTADDGPYVIALPLIDNQTFRHTLRGPKR